MTAVRRQKDIANTAKAAGDDVLRREAQYNIERYQAAYDRITDKAMLTPDKSRMRVSGFRSVSIRPAGYSGVPVGAKNAVRNTGKMVHYDRNASYSIRLEGYSDEVNAGLSRAIKNVALKGSDTGCEHMYLVNLVTGELDFYETNNQFASVGYGFRKYIKTHGKRQYAFVHNHNTDGSFSEADMQTLLTVAEIPIMIAARNDGIIYVAERAAGPLKTGLFDSLYPNEIETLNNRLRNGTITMSQRAREREEMLVQNLLRDYTKGGKLIEYGK